MKFVTIKIACCCYLAQAFSEGSSKYIKERPRSGVYNVFSKESEGSCDTLEPRNVPSIFSFSEK